MSSVLNDTLFNDKNAGVISLCKKAAFFSNPCLYQSYRKLMSALLAQLLVVKINYFSVIHGMTYNLHATQVRKNMFSKIENLILMKMEDVSYLKNKKET